MKSTRGEEAVGTGTALAVVAEKVLYEDRTLEWKTEWDSHSCEIWIKALGSKRNDKSLRPEMGVDLVCLKDRWKVRVPWTGADRLFWDKGGRLDGGRGEKARLGFILRNVESEQIRRPKKKRVSENTCPQNKGNVVSRGQERVSTGGAGDGSCSGSEHSAEWLPFCEAQNKGAIQFHPQPTRKLKAQEASPSVLPRFL